MKGGDPGLSGRNARAKEKIGNAVAHFFGGFVGEGDGENGVGRNAAGDEIGHAEGDGASFAGACSGEDEYRAFDGFGGEALLGIEFIEKS